ncbi:MAG: hypothetical protein JWM11_6833 [Planctomycetaceae bacterium]|nr:hypothetical protein [Planctomycetaceae bacterium]
MLHIKTLCRVASIWICGNPSKNDECFGTNMFSRIEPYWTLKKIQDSEVVRHYLPNWTEV